MLDSKEDDIVETFLFRPFFFSFLPLETTRPPTSLVLRFRASRRLPILPIDEEDLCLSVLDTEDDGTLLIFLLLTSSSSLRFVVVACAIDNELYD